MSFRRSDRTGPAVIKKTPRRARLAPACLGDVQAPKERPRLINPEEEGAASAGGGARDFAQKPRKPHACLSSSNTFSGAARGRSGSCTCQPWKSPGRLIKETADACLGWSPKCARFAAGPTPCNLRAKLTGREVFRPVSWIRASAIRPAPRVAGPGQSFSWSRRRAERTGVVRGEMTRHWGRAGFASCPACWPRAQSPERRGSGRSSDPQATVACPPSLASTGSRSPGCWRGSGQPDRGACRRPRRAADDNGVDPACRGGATGPAVLVWGMGDEARGGRWRAGNEGAP